MKEPQNEFKVNDYVRIDDLIGKILEDNGTLIKVEIYQSREKSHPDYLIQDVYKEYIQKWIPVPGDWVIPDTGINEDLFVVMKYNGVSLIPSRCRPFLGELPYES